MLRRVQDLLAHRTKLWREVSAERPLPGRRRSGDNREWCLAERLFLHPLNDLDVFEEAAIDILTFRRSLTKRQRCPLALSRSIR